MSEERRTVTVTVCDLEQYDGDWPGSAVADFKQWFADKLCQIPPEFMDTALVELGSVSGYEGSHYATINIRYCRPETDEERATRIARVQALQQAQERQELQQLAALKAKYGQ
jgi:hypothetical protein